LKLQSFRTIILISLLQPPPPPPEEPKEIKKIKDPQDKVKVAKNIVKDMEKWAKKLNSKKDYMPISTQQQMRNENSSSPVQNSVKEAASDICFSMLEKKDRMIPMIVPPKVTSYHHQHNSDSDENEDQAAHKSAAAASAFNENDLLDFQKLACLLCKRAFQSVEILSKHANQSNLHKENLQKYKLQNGILDMNSSDTAVENSQV
jgi:RNA-binding protein 5/10